MEHKFAAFTAYAALVAQQELGELLKKHSMTPTAEVLGDAAKYGLQRAFARFFPGLVKVPFQNDPLPEIVMALRYLYEADPEKMLTAGSAPEILTPMPRSRVSGASMSKSLTPTDTQQRRSGIVPVPLGNSDTSHRRLNMANIDPGTPTPRPFSGDESSHGAVGSVPGSSTRLRKIGPAPVFPWEKRKGDEGK